MDSQPVNVSTSDSAFSSRKSQHNISPSSTSTTTVTTPAMPVTATTITISTTGNVVPQSSSLMTSPPLRGGAVAAASAHSALRTAAPQQTPKGDIEDFFSPETAHRPVKKVMCRNVHALPRTFTSADSIPAEQLIRLSLDEARTAVALIKKSKGEDGYLDAMEVLMDNEERLSYPFVELARSFEKTAERPKVNPFDIDVPYPGKDH